jgi:S1-C subfamily serine protease
VTASAGIKDDPRFLQISVPIQPGNSGGPLVDASGNVIGITTATIDAINRLKNSGYLPQNANYALKASYLKGVFDQVRDNRLGVSLSEPRERKFEEIQRATEQSVGLIISIIRHLHAVPKVPALLHSRTSRFKKKRCLP